MGIPPRKASHPWDGNPPRAGGGAVLPSPDPADFRRRLLRWYDRHQRALPWRGALDSYQVWISEVMLQQTRAEVVAPRYQEFVARFPTLRHLAAAQESEVLAAWSGLGYYRRARHLHAAARIVAASPTGRFPRTLEAALKLPGVGAYIGRAVLSIAYGVSCAVVDGNVRRVLARLRCRPSSPPGDLQREADRLLDPSRPGDANQAMMELGATVCLPASPRCASCPVRVHCAAFALGRVAEVPTPKARPSTVTRRATIHILHNRSGRIWLELRRIPPLEGLWMLPWRTEEVAVPPTGRLGTVSHAIMRNRYRCDVFKARGKPERLPGEAAGPGAWIDPARLSEIPHSSLIRKALSVPSAADRSRMKARPRRTAEVRKE